MCLKLARIVDLAFTHQKGIISCKVETIAIINIKIGEGFKDCSQ
jgi:hypothetical protein